MGGQFDRFREIKVTRQRARPLLAYGNQLPLSEATYSTTDETYRTYFMGDHGVRVGGNWTHSEKLRPRATENMQQSLLDVRLVAVHLPEAIPPTVSRHNAYCRTRRRLTILLIYPSENKPSHTLNRGVFVPGRYITVMELYVCTSVLVGNDPAPAAPRSAGHQPQQGAIPRS